MGEMIRVENMCHAYTAHDGSEVKALDNTSLDIAKGEFVAIIGSNGSGKSTLAKHLNALLLPTGGNCYVMGMNTQDSEELWNIRQTVGMVFQNPDNQIVAAIVEEDVAFGPENLGIAPAEIVNRVRDSLTAVGMYEFREHAPHLLSGGQKQRVAIAGVLAMRPKCLVLDEPTAMLDPQGRQEVLSTVCRLNKQEGITVVYITHFMEEAVEADRVIVMSAGKVEFSGSPADVFSQVDRLKELGLDVPLAAEIVQQLNQKGCNLPKAIITNEELAVALCR